jgi:2,4-dienoyl-CoA reductase-like NADH-dependent reductase (Old Yellow Enzyme family)
MKNKEFDRREFIKIAAGTGLVMLSNGAPALFAKEVGPTSRSHNKVFSNGKIGNLQLKNRLVKAASAMAATTDDCTFLSGGYDIYRGWSKGGVGLVITGHMAVVPIPPGTFSHNLTCIYDDTFIPQLHKLAEAVHSGDSDCKAVAQISHVGMRSITNPVAASSVPWPHVKKRPRGLSTAEVRDIRDSFVAAARRAREAEFDGVEIHGAHGYLLNTFLSPYTNKRTDAYGGSLENRVRIVAEIVDRIKTSVDPDFAVLIKTNCDDGLGDAGTNADNFPQLARELEKTGIDALEISGAKPAREDIDAPENQSYFAPYADHLDLRIPVISTGGNKSIDVIEGICQRGKVDYFGFARPLIAEPDLPNRWLEMAADAQCECISCNQCLGYLFKGHNLVTCQIM